MMRIPPSDNKIVEGDAKAAQDGQHISRNYVAFFLKEK